MHVWNPIGAFHCWLIHLPKLQPLIRTYRQYALGMELGFALGNSGDSFVFLFGGLLGNSGEVARAPDEGVRIPGLAPPVKIEEHVSEGGAGEAAMETDGGGGHAADSDAHEGGTSAGAPPDAAEVDNSPRPSKKLRI